MIATSRTAMSEAFHIVARLDPITILIATGLRRSELLALRWDDYDDGAGTITVTGKVVRVAGKGLMRGSAVSRAGDWFGSPVNVASRVTGVARPGAVLVAESTHEAIGENGPVRLVVRGRSAPGRRARGNEAHSGAPGARVLARASASANR
jgi:hypothetical protein